MSATFRTHTCGELRSSHLGQTVTLCGWVAKSRNLGGLMFVDLRDRYGVTQLVFDPHHQKGELFQLALSLGLEFVIGARGTVRARPEGMGNVKRDTGQVEVICDHLQVFSEAKTTPFVIQEGMEVADALRLKYRYLDLRRPSLQKNLQMRHQALKAVRGFLDREGFIEVETPILYKSTPEGARDFLVPSRFTPQKMYALPQSPQTLKQLLMIAGMDRYFQIARCFRDENLRADRQLEFTQIDIEASFYGEEPLRVMIEGMMAQLWQAVLGVELQRPFPRMTYQEAMERFGSDKPDVRLGCELQDVGEVLQECTFPGFQGCKAIRALVITAEVGACSRKDLEEWQAEAKLLGASGLVSVKCLADGSLQSALSKYLSAAQAAGLQQRLHLGAGDCALLVAGGEPKRVCEVLGALRLLLVKKFKVLQERRDARPFAFLWVTHFPLLEWDASERRFYACHHPFTAPREECLADLLSAEPGAFEEGSEAWQKLADMQAQAYDLVLNGWEIGGGSSRIYRAEVQAAMFRVLGFSAQEAQAQFGFFLEALQYGTPPHGGIALGVERLVAILCGLEAIREVIAFPKTQKGTCLMSDAPSEVSSQQLADCGLQWKDASLGGGEAKRD